MQKNKFLIGIFVYLVISLFAVSPAYAAPIVQIQTLPDYINHTDFKLSCTSNGSTAQFYSRKDSGSYTAFGPAINLAADQCQVQVNGGQFGSEGKFWFEVIVDGVPSETSTTLDTSAPGNVGEFSKERLGGGTVYRIHWKNPPESDYQRVFIYRGLEEGFESDGKKIAEAGGNPGDTMTWDDGGLDPTKEYYYYVRAVDRANNASGLIGDQGASSTVTASGSPAGRVTTLPNENGTTGTGSILGAETNQDASSPSASPETLSEDSVNTSPGVLKWILTHKKISGGIALILLAIAYRLYRAGKKNK